MAPEDVRKHSPCLAGEQIFKNPPADRGHLSLPLPLPMDTARQKPKTKKRKQNKKNETYFTSPQPLCHTPWAGTFITAVACTDEPSHTTKDAWRLLALISQRAINLSAVQKHAKYTSEP